jgi:hypothetical protein
VYYNYGKNGHFIAQCPYERKKEDNDKIKFDKGYKKDKKYTKKKPNGQAYVVKNGTQVMRVLSQKVMRWQP